MGDAGSESTIMGFAAITNDHVPHPEIKQPVKGRRAYQDQPSYQGVVHGMGTKKREACRRKNGQPQPMGKVLLFV
jgi:hypothetical protein